MARGPIADTGIARPGRMIRSVLVVCGVVVASAAMAAASAPPFHTRLEATFPAADSLYRGEVREVRLRFSTAVQLPLSTVRVRGPDGTVLNGAGPDTVPGSGSAELRVGFGEPLPSGAYTVEWRTAGPDSHPIRGEYGFEVVRPPREVPQDTSVPAAGEAPREPGAPSGDAVQLSPTAPGQSDGAGPGPGGVAVRWLFLASVVGMLGTSVFRFTVSPVLSRERGWEEADLVGRRRLYRLAVAVAAFAVVAIPARLGVQVAAVFGEGGASVSNAWALLTSGWGVGWIVGSVAVLVFVAGLVAARRPERARLGWLLMLGGAALATVGPALSGHTRTVDPALRSLATVVDALHVAAAGTWMGGVGALVLVGVGAASRAEGPDARWALPRVVDAFSRVAVAAVAGLLATGLVNAWLHLGSLSALWESPYGRTLAVKLVLVGAAAALGLYNRQVVRPALRETPRPGLIRGPAAVELLLGIGVLLVTAVLVATPLPGG